MKSFKEHFAGQEHGIQLNEVKTNPMLAIKTDVFRAIKNKPAKEQAKIIDRMWNELSKGEGSKMWKKLNDTEKKSLADFFNKLSDAAKKGKQIDEQVKDTGYWKIGIAKKRDDRPKVVEVVTSKDQVDKGRQAHAKRGQFVFVQPATKKDFADYSNGKEVKWVTKFDERVKEYSSLNDASKIDKGLGKGNTEIWYQKMGEEISRDLGMGSKWLKQHGKMPTLENMKDTHIMIGKIAEKKLERVYTLMQGETWSPEGEARSMIKLSGTMHTSMSVGDIVKIGGKAWMVDNFGFIKLERM